MKLYPFRMPENVHPYAWVLLGFGLPGELLDKLARHLFDDLGYAMLNRVIDNSIFGR